jgi:hypothetical protein
LISLTKPSGWAFGELLTSAQMEALDASQAQAIDGVGGGTYTPSTKITINGQGLQVNSLTVTGTLSLLGNTTVGNSNTDLFRVNATSIFSAPVTLNDTLVANSTSDFFANVTVHTGGFLEVGGSASLGNDETKTLTIGATTTLNAPLTAFESADFWGDVVVHSAHAFTAAGDVTLGNDSSKTLNIGAALASVLSYTGTGRIPFKLYTGLGNSDATVSAGDGNVFHLPHSNSGVRSYKLTASGASNNDFAIFYQGFGSNLSNDIRITTDSGLLYTFVSGASASFIILFFRGSGWEVGFAYND